MERWSWKDERIVDKHGYIWILVAPKARKGHRYQLQQNIVWEASNGPVPPGHTIRHLNGVKDDNRILNLELRKRWFAWAMR